MLDKKITLETMTPQDLWSLYETISGILLARIKAEKRELEKRLAILNRSLDKTHPAGNSRSLDERPRRSYPAVLPKYRNPQTSETWAGRGKCPRWLTAAIISGHKIEEFRINEAVGTRRRVTDPRSLPTTTTPPTTAEPLRQLEAAGEEAGDRNNNSH